MALEETYFSDLVDRYVEILTSLTIDDQKVRAYPEILSDPAKREFPAFFIFLPRVRPQGGAGSGFIYYNVTVTCRLITGGAGTGSIGSHEKTIYKYLGPVASVFAKHIYLQHPVTQEPFEMLTPGISERLIDFQGPRPFNIGTPLKPVLYNGAEFIDECRLFVKR